jgi:uncharacterized protein YndB with AHSA1/START domain
MEKLAVERTIWIDAPRERVWRAITEDRQIARWWPPGNWEIPSLETGASVKFGTDPHVSLATIEVVHPPRQFTLHWQPNPTFPVDTMITTFLLEEENGGTRVTVTQTGFEALTEDVRQQQLDKTGQGYTTVLQNLKALVEGG